MMFLNSCAVPEVFPDQCYICLEYCLLHRGGGKGAARCTFLKSLEPSACILSAGLVVVTRKSVKMTASLCTCLCKGLWWCRFLGCRVSALRLRLLQETPGSAPSPSSPAPSERPRSQPAWTASSGTSKKCFNPNETWAFITQANRKTNKNKKIDFGEHIFTPAAAGRPSGRHGCWTEPPSWRNCWLWSRTWAADETS